MKTVDFQNSNSILTRASIQDYRGKRRFDIRQNYDKNGEWTPTQKGAGIPIDEAEQYLIECLEMVRAAKNG